MLQGSEIILVPNACYMLKIRLEQLKVRAYENMVGIVTVNYANYGGKARNLPLLKFSKGRLLRYKKLNTF